jgi:hypothetical protein
VHRKVHAEFGGRLPRKGLFIRTSPGSPPYLIEAARLPHVTLQVLPAIAHPATQSGFMVGDGAAYAEHVAGGYVFTDQETATSIERLFDTLRGECYRVSESLAIIGKAGELWTGASRATAGPTGETA